jgi:hypothetical protein
MGGDIAIIFAAGSWNVHVMSPSEKTRASLPGGSKPGSRNSTRRRPRRRS